MGFADAARAERLLLTDLGGTADELHSDAIVAALAYWAVALVAR